MYSYCGGSDGYLWWLPVLIPVCRCAENWMTADAKVGTHASRRCWRRQRQRWTVDTQIVQGEACVRKERACGGMKLSKGIRPPANKTKRSIEITNGGEGEIERGRKGRLSSAGGPTEQTMGWGGRRHGQREREREMERKREGICSKESKRSTQPACTMTERKRKCGRQRRSDGIRSRDGHGMGMAWRERCGMQSERLQRIT